MRIILKISGEFINNRTLLDKTVSVVNSLFKEGHKIGIVVGGGNLVRGRDFSENRAEVDKIGMYGTLINGMVLNRMLPNSAIYNAFPTSMIKSANLKDIENKILIFSGGLGVPYFSTDTTAVVRAIDINADIILKATKADGVYDKDPSEKDAKKYDKVSFSEILSKRLGIIDLTAAALALTHNKKMVVFDGTDPDNIVKAMEKKIGTIIEE